MPRILYVWKGEYPWDVRIEKICNAFLNNGFDVTLLARWGRGQQESEDKDGIKIHRVGFNQSIIKSTPISQNPVWRSAINKAINDFQPGIVMPREIMLAEACAISAHKKDIPVVMDMAENYPAAMREWKKYNQKFPRRFVVHNLKIPDRFERRSVVLMDGIITVCEEQNCRLNSQYNYSYEKMQVVHNTPELNLFDNVRKGASESPIVFGHHGFMSAEKNLDIFIKGFKIAVRENDNIRLLLAGDGECYDDLVKLTNDLDLKEYVTFTGKYSYKDIKKNLSKIDVGVIPYKVNEFNNYTIHNGA